MEAKRNNSKKRELLLEALRGRADHPTAEALYRDLKPACPQLSLGTVYRNLAVLSEQGLASAVATVDGQLRYDGRTEPHAHFICRVCSRVEDLELPDMAGPLYARAGESLGCLPEGYSLSIRGVCAACRR